MTMMMMPALIMMIMINAGERLKRCSVVSLVSA